MTVCVRLLFQTIVYKAFGCLRRTMSGLTRTAEEIYHLRHRFLIGVDEAGRGPLAGYISDSATSPLRFMSLSVTLLLARSLQPLV